MSTAGRLLLAVVCLITLAVCTAYARADTINSNSIVQIFPNESEGVDVPVEFYIQTDKPIYQLGESVNILYRVSNLGSTGVAIEIHLLARDLDIWVRQDGNTLWKALGYVPPGNVYDPNLVIFPPGETLELEWTWDMTDSYDNPVGTGHYDIFGMFGSWTLHDGATVYEHGIEVSVPITIVPEPAIVDIDIRPGGEQNPVNLRSNGVLPLAIFGNDYIDVYDIDLSSLSLDGALPQTRGNSGKVGTFRDINGDDLTDLILQFWLNDLDIAPGADELILEGLLNDNNGSLPFRGVDSIHLVGPGDVNADGFVDGSDLTIVLSNWGQGVRSGESGDLNGNGIVDGSDYNEVLSYWNPAPPEPPSQAIPEPTTLGLLTMGGLTLLRRRRSA